MAFSYPIAGLITAWGGVNSHMAIRAGELGLPSVIGAGEVLYRRWSKANRLHVGRRTQGRDLSVKTVAVSQRIDDYPDRNERRMHSIRICLPS